MKTRLFALIALLFLSITSVAGIAGCSKESGESGAAGEQEGTFTESGIEQEPTGGEDDGGYTQDVQESYGQDNIEGDIDEPTSTEESTSPVDGQQVHSEEQAGSQEGQIPLDIQNIIDDAQDLYEEGEYALAEKEYRKAQLAIEDSDMTAETKKDLLKTVDFRYQECKEIVETARMHYANSMRLQYEKRFEEAKSELEAALAIYPKYEEAQLAYETLMAMMGLS